MKWTEEKLNKLIELYPNNTNLEIAKFFNTTKPSIARQARNLKLYKNKDHKSKLVKLRTRDLSPENLEKIAKKYKTKSDFKKNDGSAYSASIVLGIKNKICSHMIPQNISRPELILKYIINKLFINYEILYNNRKIIKPYELDIYLPELKIAFEYDGLYWHSNKKEVDNKKSEMCINKGIKLFRIKEKSYYYKYYLGNIKSFLLDNLLEINIFCKTKIDIIQINKISDTEIDLFINDNILDYDNINIITKKYNNYKEFKTNEKSLYCKLIELGCIKKFTKHMKKDIIYWDKELCNEEINKYTTFCEFYKKSYKCYIYIQRNNLYYLLYQFKDYSTYLTKTQQIDDNYIINIINKLEIKTLEYFKLNYKNIYDYLVRYKKLNILNDLKKTHNKHNITEILLHDYSIYKNLQDFNKKNKALFSYARRNKLIDFIKNKIKNIQII